MFANTPDDNMMILPICDTFENYIPFCSVFGAKAVYDDALNISRLTEIYLVGYVTGLSS